MPLHDDTAWAGARDGETLPLENDSSLGARAKTTPNLTDITVPAAQVGAYVATLPLASIKVGHRFRQDPGDIDTLAASIKELGLLQPIGIDREYNLIFGQRRYLAHQLLGLDTIQARIIAVSSLLQAEHDENELRKGFTASERVAIADAIKAEIGNRRGSNQHQVKELPQNFAEVSGQETRQIAAKAAGFGNAETYRQAKAVVDKAEQELVKAMDAGEISISTAAKLAEAPPEIQRQAAETPKTAPKLARRVPDKVSSASGESDLAKDRRQQSREALASAVEQVNRLANMEKGLLAGDLKAIRNMKDTIDDLGYRLASRTKASIGRFRPFLYGRTASHAPSGEAKEGER